MLSRLWKTLVWLRSYPPFEVALVTLLLLIFHKKAVLLTQEVTGFLSFPPQPLLSELPADDNREFLLEFLVFVASGVYLAWHFRPGWLKTKKPFLPLIIWLVISIAAWAGYCFALPAWLTCDYKGERYLVGLFYTDHGRNYAKNHTCAEMIRDHPEALETLMTPESVLWSQAVYNTAFMFVFLVFLLTLIQIMGVLLILVLGHHHGG